MGQLRNRTIIRIALGSFVITFLLARILVYLIMAKRIPEQRSSFDAVIIVTSLLALPGYGGDIRQLSTRTVSALVLAAVLAGSFLYVFRDYERLYTGNPMRIPIKGWLVGGLLGGLLDLTFALGYGASKGTTIAKVLQTVASGLLGTRSFELGQTSAIMGVIAHFALSLIWAVLFYRFVTGRRWSPWVTGPIFGILVFLAMRLIVLPLSAFPYPVRFSMPGAFYDLLSHMFLFGLPIALITTGARRRLPASATLMGCLATPGST